MRLIKYTDVDAFLKLNPSGTYKEFKTLHPSFKMSDAAFYERRRKLSGKNPSKKQREYRKQRLYASVWEYPSGNTDDPDGKYKSIVKSVVSSLNRAFNLRLEVVELNDPRMIEVRRLTK